MTAYELAAENKGMREEIERLRHDIERHIAIASGLATENERLRAELAACNENLAKANQQIETLENMLLRRFGSHMPGGCYVRYADYCECGWTQERLNIEAARKGEDA